MLEFQVQWLSLTKPVTKARQIENIMKLIYMQLLTVTTEDSTPVCPSSNFQNRKKGTLLYYYEFF